MGISYNARYGVGITIKENQRSTVYKTISCCDNDLCSAYHIEVDALGYKFCPECGSEIERISVPCNVPTTLEEFEKTQEKYFFDDFHITELNNGVVIVMDEELSYTFDIVHDGYTTLEPNHIEDALSTFKVKHKKLLKEMNGFFGSVLVSFKIVGDIN